MADGNLKILIIEDEPQIRRFVRTALSAQKFEVFEAENGQQGLIGSGNPETGSGDPGSGVT